MPFRCFIKKDQKLSRISDRCCNERVLRPKLEVQQKYLAAESLRLKKYRSGNKKDVGEHNECGCSIAGDLGEFQGEISEGTEAELTDFDGRMEQEGRTA